MYFNKYQNKYIEILTKAEVYPSFVQDIMSLNPENASEDWHYLFLNIKKPEDLLSTFDAQCSKEAALAVKEAAEDGNKTYFIEYVTFLSDDYRLTKSEIQKYIQKEKDISKSR